MSQTKEQINETWVKIQKFIPVMAGLSRSRNPYEIRHYVIGKHDDHIQQYKQAVIEMEAKYTAIIDALHGKLVRDLDIEELEMNLIPVPIKRWWKLYIPLSRKAEIHNKRIYLEIEKKRREEANSLIAITGAAKEVMDFMYILENEFGDCLDKTEEELLRYEPRYWKSRLTKQISIDMMSHGRLGEGNRTVLSSMPKEDQEEIYIAAMLRIEEVKAFEDKCTAKAQAILAESYPHPTCFITPPDYTPLIRIKDAPDGYPEDRIVHKDRCEIMIATMHRPGDDQWLSEQFFIPAGKNIIKHWAHCDRPDMVGEWRNRIVKDALSLGCEHIFWVDDDLLIDNSALQKLYKHNKDIVGGWYLMKTPVPESATLIRVPGSDSVQAVPLDTKGLIKVDWALAAGLTLIKTDVFRRIQYPWYNTTKDGTEDTWFSARTREAGIESWLDCDVKAVHVNKQTMMGWYFDYGIQKVTVINDPTAISAVEA